MLTVWCHCAHKWMAGNVHLCKDRTTGVRIATHAHCVVLSATGKQVERLQCEPVAQSAMTGHKVGWL